MKDLIYKDESYRIIGACFEVYKEKGCGFLEAVYQLWTLSKTGEGTGSKHSPRNTPNTRRRNLVRSMSLSSLSHFSRSFASLASNPSSVGAVPLIDQIHRLMHLWKAGNVVKVDEYMNSKGLQTNALFPPVLQAHIEMAEGGSEERSALESLSNHLHGRGVRAGYQTEMFNHETGA